MIQSLTCAEQIYQISAESSTRTIPNKVTWRPCDLIRKHVVAGLLNFCKQLNPSRD